MEEYFFKTEGYNEDMCTEICNVKDNGIMIGSVKCRECEFCKGHEKPCEFTGSVSWIKCSRINEATVKLSELYNENH
jgi:hypothetical protein